MTKGVYDPDSKLELLLLQRGPDDFAVEQIAVRESCRHFSARWPVRATWERYAVPLSASLPRRAMDMSTPMLVAGRPIFVYIDLPLGVAANTVPFGRVPVSVPFHFGVPDSGSMPPPKVGIL